MKISRIVSILAAAVMLTSAASTASAKVITPPDIVSPQYVIAGSTNSTLTLSGSTAKCYTKVSGSKIVSIDAEQIFEVYVRPDVWREIDSWSDSVDGSTLVMDNTSYDIGYGKFRVRTEITVTDKNGNTEDITVISAERIRN